MAKTKKKRLMTSILDSSANYYLGGGDTNSYYTQQMVTDNDGVRRMQFMPSESTMTSPFDEPVGGYTRSQQRLVNKQARIDEDAADIAAGNTGSNVNVGGIIAAAGQNLITAFTDPNMKAGDRVATILGMPDLAKNWRADTTKGDANIAEMTNRINNATNRLIQDSNDTQGAFAAIKNNNNLNLIDTSGFKTPTLKDFKGKWWKNTGVAMTQGAISGSVGGPWGAAGGAVTGLLGSIGGLFGRKKRAQRALDKYKDDMSYLQRFAGNFNSFQRLNQQQSNENLLSNGLRQQRIQDLANVRAYGGNLFALGDEMSNPYSLKSFINDPVNPSLYDVGTSPLGLERMAYTDTRFVPKQLTPISYGNSDPNGEWASAANYIADYDNQRMDLFHKNLDEINTYRQNHSQAKAGTQQLANQVINKTEDGRTFLTNGLPKFTQFDLAGTFYPKIARSNMSSVRIRPSEGDFTLNNGAGGIYRNPTEDMFKLRHTVTTDDNFLKNYDKEHGTNYFDTSKVHELAHSRGLDPFYEQLFTVKGLNKNLSPDKQAVYDSYPVQYTEKNGKKIANPNYWKTPTEVISRRYEARKSLDLNPRDIVTKEYLNKPEVKKVIKENHLDMFTDDQLMTLFNEVADNNNSNSYDNVAAYGGNLFENGGETPPPYYPESQDPTAIQWLSDWYRQRPEQLKNTFYGSTYEMPNPNISGEYEDLNEIPQERILSPTNRMFGDDLYKNLIDRAATASTIYRMDMPSNTLGEYSPAGRGILTENGPVDKPNAAHTISFNMRDVPAFANPEEEYYDEETLPLRVHEYNHPITHGFESLADSINSKAKRKEGVKYDEYDDNPYEIHSYMMEFRQRAGLDPTEKVTKDVLDKHRTELKKSNLDRFTDDSLIDMLNNVVDNSTNNYNNIAAMGGQFDYNLSPNMIDLQNQSLANQKYKYMNQMQPAGFVDSGPGKIPNPGIPRLACGGKLHLNKFDYGGSMSMEDLPENMQSYGNGGTHEENPNGGIQVGVDQQGTPNLVEQGEFRYGDYVFSDRINVDPELLTEFNLTPVSKGKKKKNESYADAAKKMVKKAGDLNDPITKDTIDANMDRLKNAQEAQKFKEQQDQQLADYKSALKTPTQGNPMYGSMKYNGMGDVNQGLNEGVDSGMGAMDNSSLSNVNRSGNEMMAAYGGNLFAGGTPNLNIRRINEPALNWNDLVIQRSLPTPQYMTDSNVGNDMLVEPVDYSQMARNYDDNWLNDKWNAYGELNNYYTPEQIANLRGSFGMSISGGVDKPFVQALQQDLKNRGYYKGKIDGDFGPNTRMALDKMNGTYAWTGENGKYVAPQTTQTVTTNTDGTPGSQSYGHSFSVDKTTTRLAKDDVVDNNINVSKDATASGTTQNPQQSVNSLGDLQKLNAQYATGNPFDAPSYNTFGRHAAPLKFLPAAFADRMGLTNFDYDPNLRPNQELKAAGRTGFVPRTADHSGMYRNAELFDINAANNAAQAQAAATARAMRNVNDRNQGAANQLAADYNAMLGIGNNYQTMFDANMKSRLATDEYNKQTEQTNVQANNDMYKDNQNAGIQAKQMELNTLAQSMADQTQKELYADKTNREAHDNIAGTQTALWNNTMQHLMDEAQRNDLYNKFNSDASQMWYYDKKLGKYVFKGDPAQAYLGTAMRTAENPVTSLDADLLKQYNDYVAKVGSQNVSKEFIDNLVYQQGQRNKENEAKSIADRNAQMQSDIDFMNTQFSDLDNLTITDKDKSYKFFDYINSPKQVEAVRNFLANADVSQMNPNDYKNYKALLDNWMRMRDRQLMYRNQISPYNVADATNTTWVGQDNQAYGGYINSNKKKKKQYYTDI